MLYNIHYSYDCSDVCNSISVNAVVDCLNASALGATVCRHHKLCSQLLVSYCSMQFYCVNYSIRFARNFI